MPFAFVRSAGSVAAIAVAVTVAAAVVPAADARTAATSTAATTATALYVNASSRSCTDSGPGSKAQPFCTLQAAANVVQPGQTVYIGGVGASLTKTLTITRSGTPAAPITITTLPGSAAAQIFPVPGIATIALTGVHDVILDNLTVYQEHNQTAIRVTGSHDVTLSRLAVHQAMGDTAPLSAIGVDIDGASAGVTLSRDTVDGGSGTAVLARAGASRIVVTTSLIATPDGTGVSLVGVANAVLTGDSVSTALCGTAARIAGGTSATVENDAFAAGTDTTCASAVPALSVDSGSAPLVQADYDGFTGQGAAISWAGQSYASAAAFAAATGLGAHDVDAYAPPKGVPDEYNKLIDAANCAAPDTLPVDVYGHPRVRDPLVSGTGAACYSDIGAVEREDEISYGLYAQSNSTPAPYAASLLIQSPGLSSWNEPVTISVTWGDGSAPQTVTTMTPAHTYTVPGWYKASVTVTDTDGTSLTRSVPFVAATTAPPKATLTWRPDPAGGIDLIGSLGGEAWEVPSTTMTSGDGQTAVTTSGGGGPGAAEPEQQFIYAAPGTYSATFNGTDVLGRTLNTATTKVVVGDAYHQIGSPTVVLSQRVPAHGVVKLSKAVLGGSYAAGMRAAFSDVTVSGAAKSGSITVYPDGAASRAVTALRFTAGHAASQSTLVTPGADGDADFVNNSGGPVQLSVRPYGLDITKLAWQNLDEYLPIKPVQVLSAKTVGANREFAINVGGGFGLPSFRNDAVAVNITVSHGRTAGYLAAAVNGVHYLSWAAGQQVSRLVVLPTNGGGSWAFFSNAGTGSVVVSASVVGYYGNPWFYAAAPFAAFMPAGPAHVAQVRVAAGHAVTLPVGGRYGLPSHGVSAALVSLTATSTGAVGAIDGWAAGTARPAVPVLSYAAGTTTGTALISLPGGAGIELYNTGTAPVTVTVTLLGAYFRGP
jgi:hypothetical protein